MKIYTKTGDKGTTSLFGGKKVSKSHYRIDAYGTVDELNSYIGVVRDQPVNESRKNNLIFIQDRLFTIGSVLATAPGNTKVKVPEVLEEDVLFLEKAIDEMDKDLPAMKNFVLPGGHQSVSLGHVARTVCRRAERQVIALAEAEEVNDVVIKFLNRLSDYLFVLCRKMAAELGADETPWKPKI